MISGNAPYDYLILIARFLIYLMNNADHYAIHQLAGKVLWCAVEGDLHLVPVVFYLFWL